LWLGGLIVYQVFITEENLLMTALALAIFVICYGFSVRSEIRAMLRPFLKGIAAALAVSLPLLAFPLYEQFFGRQHYDGFGQMAYVVNGIEAFTAYSTGSIGNQGGPLLSFNWSEANAYFGWPLLILATAITVWLWKDRLVRSTALVGAICAILSLGPEPAVSAFKHPHPTLGVPGPWALFSHLPVFEAMNAGRLTFVTVVCLAVLLAIATDRVIEQTAEAPARKVRILFAAAMASALLPLLPLPVPAHGRQPLPVFITSGAYKSYVAKNHTLVPVPPLVATSDVHALDWQVASGLAFRLPGGYFMGPVGPKNEAGNMPEAGPMTKLTAEIIKGGKAVKVTEEQKAAIIAELRRLQADAVVVYNVQVLPQLKESLDPLFGPGQQVDDVWVWDIRPLTRS
jgi:dolichyl-phosphate beta-glucosyltransferase